MTYRPCISLAVAILAMCSCTSGSEEILAELDRYKATFSEYPSHVPTNKTADAPLAGNGDIGLTMKASEEGVTFFIGKNDFWRGIESYPEGGVGLPGAVSLTSDVFTKGTYFAEQLPGSAEIRASFKTEDNLIEMTAWVPATDNKVIIEMESQKEITMDIGFVPTKDDPVPSVIEQGGGKGCSWMTRSFCDNPRLKWDTHVALALNRETGEVSLKPGRKQQIVLAVYTNHDTPEWKEKAVSEALSCGRKDVRALKKQHRQWWSSFWSLSHVNIGDEMLERYYYQSQYLFACSSREGKVSPGLWGPFISTDNTAWAGDYHLNYNYQSPYWGCYSSNQICLTDNYDKPLLDYIERGSAYAKELLGCRGIYCPVGIGPSGLTCSAWPDTDEKMKRRYHHDDRTVDGGAMFWGQKSNASFGAVNMMMRFYATWDKAYAERIYPYILACADFWEDYLVLRDGRYESQDDCFYEEWPWGNVGEKDVNPMASLGLIRMVMRGALDISGLLGVDADRKDRWNDILEHLSPFPVGANSEGRLSLKYSDRRGVNGDPDKIPAQGIDRVHMHGVLIPPMVSGPLTDSTFAAIMLDDVNHWTRSGKQDWGRSLSNGVETVYAGAARLGFDPQKLLDALKERIELKSYPNCYIVAAGGGLETLAAVPFTVNEMLMQSFEGVLRIFPCWVRMQDASFHHLRANGAFLVSSSISGGTVGEVELFSEQGRSCKMENPWPGKNVVVRHGDGSEEILRGRFVEFSTEKGESLICRANTDN